MEERHWSYAEHTKPFKHQEGELTVTRGSAWSGPGCHLGCGVLLYTDKSGKLVKVEGDPENPYNDGRLCVRCLNINEVTNHKDRLLYPMKRDPKDRGQNKWERISWEEAYDLIVEKFNKIKEENGAESVIFTQGTGRDIAQWISRLAWSFGSPNYCYPLSGAACYLPRVAGMVATTGNYWVADASQQFIDRYDNPEYKVPETMFIWGNYPLTSNSDGFYGHWVIDLMKRGMKIVCIDPKITWLAARAEEHLRVRPGTDAALALGMLNVVINEELYDKDFIKEWTYGFDQLKERVQDYPVDKVAEITWVPAEKIRNAAHILAKSKPATMQWGLAVDMTKESLPASQAIAALFYITGNADVPGGVIVPPELLPYSGGFGRELLSQEQAEKRIGLKDYPLLQYGFQIAQPDAVQKALETGVPYKIHGAWYQTTNPVACIAAEPKKWEEAVKKLDFVVFVDIFMTPSIMAVADVVLPAATFPERDGLRVGDGAQRGEVINKVTQIGECKSDMQINLELGKRFNPEAWPWEDVQDMFTHILKPTGFTFQELAEKAPAYMPFNYKRYEKGLLRQDGELGFNTATGKIELYSTFYEMAGLDPLPYFEEPSPGPGATPELLEEYPLVLTTGARIWSMFHSEHRQIERNRALRPDPEIEVNPETCTKMGIKDGDWVWVENQRGRAQRKVKATPVMDPRMVSCDHAWWRPEASPENLYDVYELNVNNLVPWIPGRSGFGSNFKTMLCKLYKVKDGE
ncbi:molybdopterin-dependent oxidoreductase [Desulfitobacterium chlororespirans]|uniref:Anaerobic selenocysteine-containing dehydrogenase n=1 Tax=Desulfitobacterium chlororespirans DSM 11544 TaxID=1121395 RepID=A0A1M7SHD8_9FIRM|nr:molybdopterin-dependent oxidoreductase [Desulfitobacterium chlororespirans]SHN57861.1 Anaerobic selenocysteine-containing dehydrogenase [Desulfitobacterium chlororespirans DSM 11544]